MRRNRDKLPLAGKDGDRASLCTLSGGIWLTIINVSLGMSLQFWSWSMTVSKEEVSTRDPGARYSFMTAIA